MRSINGNSDDIVGFRFHPTDKELVDHYLWNKIHGRDSLVQSGINEVDDLFTKDPWELPGLSRLKSADQVWYFFSRRGINKRVKRVTDNGFWKITGKHRDVKGKNGSAVKKSLVFFLGRISNRKWTPWVIHEYTFTSTVPDNKEGIFLCILKNKEDEKANTLPSESCQPSEFTLKNIEDEKANTLPGESCQPSEVADEEIPDISIMFNPDEILAMLEPVGRRHELESCFSLAKDLLMHEDQLPSFEELARLNDFGVSLDEIFPDERSSEQVLENEGCDSFLADTSMTCPEEPSSKSTRFEDGVLCRAIVNEECQPMVESDSMMLDEYAESMKLPALIMVNAPNVNLTAIPHDPHGRESMVYVHNESEKIDAPAVESVVDPHRIVHATSFHKLHSKMERSQESIEKENYPKRITKRRKFYEEIVPQDKTIYAQQHSTAVNLPLNETPTISNGKCKTTERNYGNMKLQMHLNESADSDIKGFLMCINKPSLNHKSRQPPIYFVNALLGIILLFISVIYELISVAIGPRLLGYYAYPYA